MKFSRIYGLPGVRLSVFFFLLALLSTDAFANTYIFKGKVKTTLRDQSELSPLVFTVSDSRVTARFRMPQTGKLVKLTARNEGEEAVELRTSKAGGSVKFDLKYHKGSGSLFFPLFGIVEVVLKRKDVFSRPPQYPVLVKKMIELEAIDSIAPKRFYKHVSLQLYGAFLYASGVSLTSNKARKENLVYLGHFSNGVLWFYDFFSEIPFSILHIDVKAKKSSITYPGAETVHYRIESGL